jgi:hypothetical protein
MLGDVKRTYRRVAAALALLGVAFYALLLPWHLTSQFTLGLYEAEFGPIAQVVCGKSADGVNPSLPGAPATRCPLCKGLAAFQLTLASAPPAVALSAMGEVQFTSAVPADAAGAALPTARSRGPPLLPSSV